MISRRNKQYPFSQLSVRIPSSLLIALAFVGGVYLGHYIPSPSSTTELQIHSSSTKVCFTPGDNCEDLVIQAINSAQKEILVQAYSFTSQPIAEALAAAHRRDVSVKLLYDLKASREKNSQVSRLESVGIHALPEKEKGIAHNKVMVLDGATIITGSYNWTKAARDRNSENLILIKDSSLASLYRVRWHELADKSH